MASLLRTIYRYISRLDCYRRWFSCRTGKSACPAFQWQDQTDCCTYNIVSLTGVCDPAMRTEACTVLARKQLQFSDN
jgi:hypothetical protein